MENLVNHIGWKKYHEIGRKLLLEEKELWELILSASDIETKVNY